MVASTAGSSNLASTVAERAHVAAVEIDETTHNREAKAEARSLDRELRRTSERMRTLVRDERFRIMPAVERATINDVSDTALWIAAYRARETESTRPLFRDPLAARLAGDKGRALAKRMPGAEQFFWMTVVRTVVIDELLLEAIARGAGTVLNLGAGLDTRPYRLKLPAGVRWIEADMPGIIARKEQLLRDERPHCELVRRAVDLSDAPARRALLDEASSGGDVVVLTEGVLGYLSEPEVSDLARDVHAQARLRTWIADSSARFLNRIVRARVQRRELEKAPIRFEPDDWEAYFRDRGFRLGEMRYLPIEGERLGRPLPLPIWFRPVHAVLPRRARRAIRQMFGYGRLERM